MDLGSGCTHSVRLLHYTQLSILDDTVRIVFKMSKSISSHTNAASAMLKNYNCHYSKPLLVLERAHIKSTSVASANRPWARAANIDSLNPAFATS